MIEISLNNVKKDYGLKPVLNGLNLEVLTRDRIAIVGKNGAGKTTIFKIIAGLENIDAGSVSIRKGANIGLLEQIPLISKEDYKVIDVLQEAYENIFDIDKRMKILEDQMSKNSNCPIKLEKIMKEYGKLQELYISMGGYETEENFGRICTGFKIDKNMLEQNFNILSGGQKTLVKLATLLLKKPEILLLDEPTNHLDIETLEWFENFLVEYNGTILINSHDRYFLDKVTNKTLVVEDGKSELYHGNYSYYVKEEEKNLLLEFESYKNQQKQIEAMKEAIKRYRDWGARAGNERFFKQAANLEKRLERMEKVDRPNMQDKKIPLNFSMTDRSGNDVLKVVGLHMKLGSKILFKGLNINMRYKERVGLLGKNGSGKTTLFKLLLSMISPDDGKLSIGSNVKIGYIPQDILFDDVNQTVLDVFRRESSGNETTCRATLAKFLFYGENVFKVGQLSGGEKVRLKLVLLIQKDVNLLMLDEPTNHIDIDTREMLEEAILDYKGSLLFISHDRYFINKIASRVIEIDSHIANSYLGNYDDYKFSKNKKSHVGSLGFSKINQISNSIESTKIKKNKMY